MDEWQTGLVGAVDQSDWTRVVDLPAAEGARRRAAIRRGTRRPGGGAFVALVDRLGQGRTVRAGSAPGRRGQSPTRSTFLRSMAMMGRDEAVDIGCSSYPPRRALQLTEAASALADVAVHLGRKRVAGCGRGRCSREPAPGGGNPVRGIWRRMPWLRWPWALRPPWASFRRRPTRLLEGFSQGADESMV